MSKCDGCGLWGVCVVFVRMMNMFFVFGMCFCEIAIEFLCICDVCFCVLGFGVCFQCLVEQFE